MSDLNKSTALNFLIMRHKQENPTPYIWLLKREQNKVYRIHHIHLIVYQLTQILVYTSAEMKWDQTIVFQ